MAVRNLAERERSVNASYEREGVLAEVQNVQRRGDVR